MERLSPISGIHGVRQWLHFDLEIFQTDSRNLSLAPSLPVNYLFDSIFRLLSRFCSLMPFFLFSDSNKGRRHVRSPQWESLMNHHSFPRSVCSKSDASRPFYNSWWTRTTTMLVGFLFLKNCSIFAFSNTVTRSRCLAGIFLHKGSRGSKETLSQSGIPFVLSSTSRYIVVFVLTLHHAT